MFVSKLSFPSNVWFQNVQFLMFDNLSTFLLPSKVDRISFENFRIFFKISQFNPSKLFYTLQLSFDHASIGIQSNPTRIEANPNSSGT